MANIFSYNQIIELLTDISRRHYQLNTFYLGRNWELENSEDITYPLFQVYPDFGKLTNNGYSEYKTQDVRFVCKVIDKTFNGEENEKDVHSDTLRIAQDIVNEFSQHPFYIRSNIKLIGDVDFRPLEEFEDDITAGWEFSLTFRIINLNTFCGMPIEQIPGYSATGPTSDGIIVNVNYLTCETLPDCPTITTIEDTLVDLQYQLDHLPPSGLDCNTLPDCTVIQDINSDITSISTLISGKQDTLVSGTNIKTINGSSILGSGNLQVGTILGTLPATVGKIPFTNGIADTLTTGGLNWDNSTSTLSGITTLTLNNSVYSNFAIKFGTAVGSPSMFCASPGYQLSFAFTNQLLYYSNSLALIASLTDAGLFSCKNLNVGSGTPLTNQTMNIVNSISGVSTAVGFSVTNTDTTGVVSNNFGESLSNRLSIGRYGSTSTQSVSGTSLNYQNSSLISATYNGSFGGGNLYIQGSPIINIIGATSTNYGTRLDANGLRIDTLANLHTTNTNVFQVGSSLTYNGTNLNLGATNSIYPAPRLNINNTGLGGTYGSALSITNTTSNQSQFVYLNESILNVFFFGRFNSAYTGNLGTTNIPLANLAAFGNGGNYHLPITINGGAVYQLIGVNSTNGTKVDGNGLRVAFTNLNSANLNAFTVEGKSFFGTHTSATAFVDISASNSSSASLRIRNGVTPTTTNDGDIWYDGTDLKMRVGGVTKTFTLI